tara:strand:- start:106 stop:564 length:459 start_codon:yes stop_codon:yes gene_type:complete
MTHTDWTQLDFEDFMALWRKMRVDLPVLSAEELGSHLREKFARFPIETGKTLDPYSPSNWPSPWEQITDSLFCSCGLGVFLYYTISLSESYADDDFGIYYVEKEGYDRIVIVNNTHGWFIDTLTYDGGTVSDLQVGKILASYSSQDLPRYNN